MGYTHYWRQEKGAVPADAWGKILADAKALVGAAQQRQIQILAEYDEPGSEPVFDNEGIFLNGAGDKGHETFALEPLPERSFNFCKTEHKPYDLVVVGILAIAVEHAPDHIQVSSDGDAESWADGLAFAKETLGRDVPLPAHV